MANIYYLDQLDGYEYHAAYDAACAVLEKMFDEEWFEEIGSEHLEGFIIQHFGFTENGEIQYSNFDPRPAAPEGLPF
jgi:hypothetical protein